MRLAIIGSGKIVQEVLPVLGDLPAIELRAICGRAQSTDKLNGLAAKFGIRRVYTDFAECLADPNLDTAYIALPNTLHYEYAKAALLAGKNLICEKPFTMNLAQFDELQQIAEDKQLILVEAITTAYQSNYLAVKECLPEIGVLKMIQCGYSQYSSRYDAFERGEIAPAFDPAMGGGALMDLGIYPIHFAVGLLGEPVSVSYSPNMDKGVDTSGVAVLDYGDHKVVCVCAKDSGAPNRQVIQGVKGSIIMDAAPNECGPFTVDIRGCEPRHIDRTVHPHRMFEEFQTFERMIAEHDLAGCSTQLDHSRRALSVLVQARASY